MSEKPNIIDAGKINFSEKRKKPGKAEKPLPTQERMHLMYLVSTVRSIKVFELDKDGEEILNLEKTNIQRAFYIREVHLEERLATAKKEKIFMPFKGKIQYNKEGLVDIL